MPLQGTSLFLWGCGFRSAATSTGLARAVCNLAFIFCRIVVPYTGTTGGGGVVSSRDFSDDEIFPVLCGDGENNIAHGMR